MIYSFQKFKNPTKMSFTDDPRFGPSKISGTEITPSENWGACHFWKGLINNFVQISFFWNLKKYPGSSPSHFETSASQCPASFAHPRKLWMPTDCQCCDKVNRCECSESAGSEPNVEMFRPLCNGRLKWLTSPVVDNALCASGENECAVGRPKGN